MTGQHKSQTKTVRMPGDLLDRVEGAAKAAGESVNGFIVAAVEERLAGGVTTPGAEPVRGSGGSTTSRPGRRARAAEPERPAGACRHPGFRGVKGVCQVCHQLVGY